MTETASQIAALKSERFLQGNNSSGQVLPHAKVSILSPAGKLLEPNQTGTVTLQAGSLALGYYPEFFPASEAFQTDDLGFFDSQGNLNIVARSSTKIITGGENVFPSEVEAAIRATGLVKDVAVIGLPDQNWGERVTAVYAPHNLHLSPQQIQESLAGKLARFKCPKLWVPVVKLPSNEQGKVNHKQLQQIATQWQQEHAMG
jgi:O-succinylbenzoic acid--CoA ligase